MIEYKLGEHSDIKSPKIEEYKSHYKYTFGKVEISFIRLNHSIPDMFGIVFRTDQGILSIQVISRLISLLLVLLQNTINSLQSVVKVSFVYFLIQPIQKEMNLHPLKVKSENQSMSYFQE